MWDFNPIQCDSVNIGAFGQRFLQLRHNKFVVCHHLFQKSILTSVIPHSPMLEPLCVPFQRRRGSKTILSIDERWRSRRQTTPSKKISQISEIHYVSATAIQILISFSEWSYEISRSRRREEWWQLKIINKFPETI